MKLFRTVTVLAVLLALGCASEANAFCGNGRRPIRRVLRFAARKVTQPFNGALRGNAHAGYGHGGGCANGSCSY